MKSIKQTVFFLVLSFLFAGHSSAQTIQWQNTIGGYTNDFLFSVKQTKDKGYILGGISNSTIYADKTEAVQGGFDYWIVKLDSTGAIQWQNTIGGSSDDMLYSIQQTSDGGYILGGTSNSPLWADKTENSKGGMDYWVIKLDSTGTIQWQNTIGGNQDDELFSVQQTTDGGYILGGFSESNSSGDKTENCLGFYDYWVIKLNSNGLIQWQNTIGGNNYDALYSIQQTTDKGYILGGTSSSPVSGDKTENDANDDYWIVKIDSAGAIQWQNTIGGSSYETFSSLQQVADGGYIVGGSSMSDASIDKTEDHKGAYDYWIVKLSATGTIQWENTVGGNKEDELYSIKQTNDGGYIIGGTSESNASWDKSENSNGDNYDYWIIKVDSTGTIQWEKTLGGNYYDNLYSVQETFDGGYILGGRSMSDSTGNKTENSKGDFDYWVLKLAPITCMSPYVNTIASNPSCTLDSAIININGNLNDAAMWYLYTGNCGSTLIDSTSGSSFIVYPSTTTTYYIKGEGNCISNEPCKMLTITYTTPISLNLGNDTLFCVNSNASLDAGTGFLNYSWSTGDTSQITNVPTSWSGSFIYYVTINDSTGCTATDSINVMVSSCLGIGEEYSETTISIFPNPVNDVLMIEINSNEEKTIHIMNVEGKVMYRDKIYTNRKTVDASAFPNGVYLLLIENNDGSIITKRFIK